MFDHAAGRRCILVLEDIDVFAPRRDDRASTAEAKAITSALLTCIAARRSVLLTLARTNEPNLLDPAIWPHFDVHLETLYLTFEVRVAIARAPMDGKAPEGHLRAIAWAAEGATAAEVEALVRAVSATRPLIGGKPAPLLEPLKASAMWRSQMDPTRRALLLGDSAPLFREWSRDAAPQLSLEEIGRSLDGTNRASVANSPNSSRSRKTPLGTRTGSTLSDTSHLEGSLPRS